MGVNFLHFVLVGKIIIFERERGRGNIGPGPKKDTLFHTLYFMKFCRFFPQILPRNLNKYWMKIQRKYI
jgi:hypothetical protein